MSKWITVGESRRKRISMTHSQPQPEQTVAKTSSPYFTLEQYNAMQTKAHELGMHLTTPYRKNLVNIKVGVITNFKDIDYTKFKPFKESIK